MKTCTLTRDDGATASVKAARFETDGAGTRLYDEDGSLIATFIHGKIIAVVDAAAAAFSEKCANRRLADPDSRILGVKGRGRVGGR